MATYAYGCAGTKDRTTEDPRMEIERAGYKVDHWYADDEASGKACVPPMSQRPQFAGMLAQIGDGDTLVVARLERLGCDAHDIDATIKTLAARRIKVIVLQLGKLDLISAAGAPMLKMLSAIAEIERDLPERTVLGHARPKSQGKARARQIKTTPEQRASIVTEYSMGCSVAELARRYHVSRGFILSIVTPQQKPEEPLPMGWGD